MEGTEEEEDPYQTAETQVTGKEKTEDGFAPQFVDGNEENSKFASILSKKEKDIGSFEESLGKNLFDFNQWNRPLRYIKNNAFQNAVRNEMSHYFFYPCQSDGKAKVRVGTYARAPVFLTSGFTTWKGPSIWI